MYQKLKKDQQELCEKYGASYREADLTEIVGVSQGVLEGIEPINGLRHPSSETTSGWYLWTGELSESVDFFKPIHTNHLLEIRPELAKYMGLPPGWRFLIEPSSSYEDVWQDQSLLDIDD